jgi:uncharacterized membrane protein YqjE
MMASPTYDGYQAEEQPLGELFSELTQNLQVLLRKEVELARVEVTEQVARAGRAGAMLGGAAVMALFGVLLVFFAAAWGLAEVMPAGLAFAAVAVVCFAVTGVLATVGRKRLAGVGPPQQTVETLKRDVQVAQKSLSKGMKAEPPPAWKG